MAIDFQPEAHTGKLASRWLNQSGLLSKAEQLFLDTWMTRQSRDLRNTIGRECMRLYDAGVFDTMPNLSFVPKIETVAEAGARKFKAWLQKCEEAIPKVVRSGFASLVQTIGVASEDTAFSDVEAAFGMDDSPSKFLYRPEHHVQNGLRWQGVLWDSARVVLETPDLRLPVFSPFPTVEQATVFVFHHETAHATQLARLAFDQQETTSPRLLNSTPEQEASTWFELAWKALFTAQPQGMNNTEALEFHQTLWSEYYADVGGVLMHARGGHNTAYLDKLIDVRSQEHPTHRTDGPLRHLQKTLDFHPIVVNAKINGEQLHVAIEETIGPFIGQDILAMATQDGVPGANAEVFNALFAELPAQAFNDQTFLAMNAATGGHCPKLAYFLANMPKGPSIDDVAQAFGQSIPGPHFVC